MYSSKFDTKNEKNRKFVIHSRKKVCKYCRSRQELSKDYLVFSIYYLLVKIGVDTAENEPLKVWRKIQFMNHYSFASLILIGPRNKFAGRILSFICFFVGQTFLFVGLCFAPSEEEEKEAGTRRR